MVWGGGETAGLVTVARKKGKSEGAGRLGDLMTSWGWINKSFNYVIHRIL